MRILRKAGIGLAIVAIVVLVILLILQTPPVRRYVLTKVEATLAKRGIALSASALDYNVFNLSATLQDVVISSMQHPQLPPVARVKRVYVNMAAGPLVGGIFDITDAQLDRPILHVVVEGSGASNIPSFGGNSNAAGTTTQNASSGGALSGSKFSIEHLAVKDGSFFLQDIPAELSLKLPGWNFEVKPASNPELRQAVFSTSQEGDVVLKGRVLPINSVHLNAEVGVSAIEVHEAKLQVGSSSLVANGEIEDISSPRLKLKAKADLSLKEVAAFAGVDEPVAGELHLGADLTGPIDSMRAVVQASSGGLRYADIRSIQLNADATLDRAAHRVHLASVEIHSSAGDVQAHGNIALNTAAGESSLQAHIHGLNLRSITRILHTKLEVASRADGAVSLSWPGMNVRQASGRGALHFVALQKQPGKNVLPLSGDMEAVLSDGKITLSIGQPHRAATSAKFRHENARVYLQSVAAVRPRVLRSAVFHPGSFRVRLLESAATVDQLSVPASLFAKMLIARAAESSGGGFQALQTLATLLRGRVTISTNGHISGKLHAHVTDINDLLNKLAAFQGEAKVIKVPVQGTADVYATLAGTISAPQITLRLLAPSLEVATLRPVAIQMTGEYRAPNFIIRSATARWGNASLSASGKLSLRANGPVDVNVQLVNAEIAPLLQALGKGSFPVKGVLSATAHMGGTLQNPRATVSASGEQLEAYGEQWGRFDVQGRMENQEVYIDRLHLQQPAGGGTLAASGSYALKSKAYTLALQSSGMQLKHLQLPRNTNVTGVVQLSARGSGTVEDPVLDANFDATSLKINEQTAGTISATVSVANQRARVALHAPALNVVATADVGIHVPYTSTFALDVTQLNLAALPLPASGKQLSGVVTAHLQGAGDLQHPKDINGSLRVDQLAVNRGALHVHSTGPINVSYEQQMLSVQPFTIAVDGAELEIAGNLPLEAGNRAASLRVKGSVDLQTIRNFAPQLRKARARGSVMLDVNVGGSLSRLDPEGTITLHNGFFSPPTLPSPVRDIEIALQLQNGVLQVQQAQATWASGSIRATGTLPLSLLPAKLPIYAPPATGPAKFSLEATGLKLEQLPKVPPNTNGTASFTLNAQAAKLALSAITAQLRFNELELSLKGAPIRQQGNSVIAVKDGQASVEHFHLEGPATEINIGGTVGLGPPEPLDVHVAIKTNAALASSFISGVTLAGQTDIDLTASGNLQSPNVSGHVSVQEGQFAVSNPDIAVTNLALRLDLHGTHIQLSQLKGDVNGGELTGGGGFDYKQGEITNSDLNVAANNVYFDFPEGLRTVSNINMYLKSQQEVHVLGGQVTIEEGSFRRYINLQGQVLNFLQTGNSGINLIGQRNPFLSSLQFDIGVKTESPLLIENNIAQAAVIANMKLVGNYYRPSVTGTVQLEETGQLYLNGNTFYVDTAIANFTSTQRIEANLNVIAEAKVDNYDITLQVQGPAGKLKTTLTSTPPLSEQDIISVLVFGQPLQQVRGAEVDVASQELLAYVAGGLGSALSNQLQRAVGLSEVRVEPVLIAGEADPNARLTIGQNLTSALKLTYSINMIDAGDQIWIGEYDFTRRFSTSVTKQSDNSYRFDLNNDWRFGGTPLASGHRNGKSIISSLHFTGNSNLSEEQLQDRMKIHPGEKYDFFKVQKGTERLQHFYNGEDRLEARVHVNTERNDGKVNLQVKVDPGAKVRFVYEGWSPPRSVRDRVTDIWRRGVFDLQRAQDATAAVRTYLVNHGYLQATINHQIRTSPPEDKEVVFDITRGQRFQNVRITFPGAKRFSDDDLLNVLRQAKLRNDLLNKPAEIRALLQKYYYDHGFLTASIKDPDVRVNKQENTGTIAIPVHEGPQYHIRSVHFEGNKVFQEPKLKSTADLTERQVYTPNLDSPAIMRLQDLYWDAGFNDMTVQLNVQPFRRTNEVGLTFDIHEGKQQILHQINVSGTDQTTPALVSSQITVKPGEPLSSSKLSKSQSDLYNTGAFQVVEFNRQILPPIPDLPPEQVPTNLNIHVHEVQPFRFQYGGYYDTYRGPGVIVNLSNTNTLGDARVVGLQARYDADLQDARLYFSQPFLRRFPVSTIGGPFYTRNVHPNDFIDDHIGATIGQELRFHDHYVLDYGYRMERTRIFNLTGFPLTGIGPEPPGGGPEPPGGNPGNGVEGLGNSVTVPPYGSISRRLSPVTVTLTRDTRDDVLNTTKGLFLSQGISTAFGFLGSQDQYVKYFGQYFQVLPLGKPVPVPFKPLLKKPRFLYAGAIRIGIAGGIGGEDLIQSERFFAGGGTTIRGFAEDSIGPANQAGIPVGGDALFILNNEIRFPLVSIFDGAGFVDIGNVYLKPSDFNPIDVREGAGFGIRIHTPWVLIRADYGIKLDRRPGESFGAYFISIGQAF